MKKILMMLLAALLVFSFVACEDEEEEAKKAAVVVITPGKAFSVTEENFASGYARFKMSVVEDTTYTITVTSLDADGNVDTAADFNVATYSTEEDMLANETWISDNTAASGVCVVNADGNDFYGPDTEAGMGFAFFDILETTGNKTYTILTAAAK
ncbi:MAG: hypothetical protein PF637_04315 [Spirochaetes bacterium]|jgi:hypothetical protein|nr:hypothetical protein [Spirochaetota bacterium]